MNRNDLEKLSDAEVKKFADEGHYAAIFEYAFRLKKQKKYQDAFDYFYKIKDYNNFFVWQALVDIADYYVPGLLSDKEIFELLVRIHNDIGNSYSLMLAHFYRDGRGTRKNYKKYIAILTECMRDGSHYAAIELGECYEQGIYVRRSYRKAFDIYDHFVDEHCKPDATCCYRAAMMMLEGKGRIKKNMLSVKYNLRVASRSIPEAKELYIKLFKEEPK